MMPTSLAEIDGAFWIDFEGTMKDPPSLLGVLEGSGNNRFEQIVFEEALFPAAMAKSKGGGAQCFCQRGDYSDTLTALVERAHDEGRHIVAWSQYELDVIKSTLPRSVGINAEGRYVNAKNVAKQWLRTNRPGVTFPKAPRGGRHSLSNYLKEINYQVPTVHGQGNTGQRIAYLRAQLDRHDGDYESISAGAKRKWSNLLQHNYHDCFGMREVVLIALK